MHSAVYATAILCVCLFAGIGSPQTAEPEIVEIYPNPVTPGDSGEFVRITAPEGTNISAYRLADEQASVRLSARPSTTATNRSYLTFSTAANRTQSVTKHNVVSLPERIQLANNGERVQLLRNGTVVDEVRYGRAPEGERYNTTSETWEALGRTDQPIVTQTGEDIEAFVLPDEPARAVHFLSNATERILLAGYTISSDDYIDELIEAHNRGVTVTVLLEASPVGGLSSQSASALDRLTRSGIDVQVISGELARYRYHHPKYAIVDDRALVTTENWKRSGLGGESSRGWGVITDQQHIVTGLAETFQADSSWVDTQSWLNSEKQTVTEEEPADKQFPQQFEAASLPVDRTHLLLAPDNLEATLTETIRNAEESIDIMQVQIGSRGFPLLTTAIDAAKRGVEVRILLSGAWYAEEENRQLKRWLDKQAASKDLSLSVRIAEPDGQFEKIHAKGLIVDGNKTFVGSANWNNNSVRENREVGLLLEGQAVGDYFQTVFESDWSSDEGTDVPVGYILACLVGAIIAVIAGQKIRFEE
ncbi:phosphatidylserine/phosphatidylglycerophosphate/cardiolipin synthase family protein [Halovenus rubra]|uniref:Phosphatidylserine/phosphatidylglycerophosphate/ cardiolipin synthase family protein n=2 Tax=Halovenus rubra TaxID=869890 RepID=A0ABD5X8J9_9EURY